MGDSGLGGEVGEGRGENIRAPVASLKRSEVVSGHAAIVGSAPSAAGLVHAIGGVSENVAVDNDFIQFGTSVIVISGRRDLNYKFHNQKFIYTSSTTSTGPGAGGAWMLGILETTSGLI